MNRNEMNNFVASLAQSSSGKSVGVLFADLKGLKTVNDNYGHNADELMYVDKKHYYEQHAEKNRGIIDKRHGADNI